MNKEIILIFDEIKIQLIKINKIYDDKIQVKDIAFTVKSQKTIEIMDNKIGYKVKL